MKSNVWYGMVWMDVCMYVRKIKHTLWKFNIAIENHNFSWVNQLFLWPFSTAMFAYQRVAGW